MSSLISDRLGEILDRFDEAWNGPTPPRIEDYLAEAETEERLLLLRELVGMDLEHRLRAGERVRLEETYPKRFPELFVEPPIILALVKQEFEFRLRNEPDLSPNEYLERFPEFRSELLAQLPTILERRDEDRQQEIAEINAKGDSGKSDSLKGQILSRDRYRIIEKLGEGAMGRVYLAEDLRTNHAKYALKLLPEHLASHHELQALLHQEVLLAQKVAHRYVCRVYHIDYLHDSQPFLIMQYIEGENLEKFWKQGRRPLPGEDVKWARQLCEGLGELHRNGILHRDLKPSNVMLDKRSGEVRLTDFGLAALAEDVTRSRIHWGTPLYQAPEQLARREVTQRSDLYALGLILYELFTGRQAFPLPTDSHGKPILRPLDEEIRIRQQCEFDKPSKHVRDLDPRVENVILRCLEPEPWCRPNSAVEVARSLPGANPEELARAAGSTTTPGVAADIGEPVVWPLWLGGLLLALVLFSLMGVVWLADYAFLHRKEPPMDPPVVLRDKAQKIIANFVKAERKDDTYIWLMNVKYRLQLSRMKKQDSPEFSPIITYFCYRQSPQNLAASDNRFLSAGIITAGNPPREPGMSGVALDAEGRLLEFYFVPDTDFLEGKRRIKSDLWESLNDAGFKGIKQEDYEEKDPVELNPQLVVNPQLYCTMKTWVRREPNNPDFPKQIDVGTCRGQTVYVRTANKEEWTSPYDYDIQHRAVRRPITALIFVVVLAPIIWYAARNYRRGRADLRGAIRLFIFLFFTSLFAGLVGIDHTWGLEEMDLLLANIGSYSVLAIVISVCYLAVEPFARKRWPSRISSWHRVLAGRIQEPLVGRDVLIGCLLGIACLFVRESFIAIAPLLHLPTVYIDHLGVVTAAQHAGPRPFYFLLMAPFVAVGFGLFGFFIAFLLYRLVFFKKPWLSWPAYYILSVGVTRYLLLPSNGIDSYPTSEILWTVLSLVLCWGAAVYVTWRFGLLASISASFTHLLLILAPMTSDFSVWYAWRTRLVLFVIASLATYACLIALGGPTRVSRLMFGDD